MKIIQKKYSDAATNMKSFMSVRHKITAAVTAVFLLLQICMPAVAAAAILITNDSISQAMTKPQFQLSRNGGYLYEQAVYDDSQFVNSKNIVSFHDELLAANLNVGAPRYVPIAGDITIFVPTYPAGKLIGDNYVQNRYIRQQITNLLGRQMIDSATDGGDEKVEINRLYTNAKSFAIAKNGTYKYGDNLPAAETITADMIWPELRTVNGQQVMVPIVYLTSATITKFAVSDHKVEFLGGSAGFKTITLDHTTLISGVQTVIKTAADLNSVGSTITSAGELQLVVGGTLNNIGSSIVGQSSVKIIAGQINNKTELVPYTDRYGSGTRLGRVASINSTTGDITLTATGDILFEASNAIATNGSITLNANNILIKPLFLNYQSNFVDGSWSVSNSSIDVVGSRLSAQNTISLAATGAITISGSELISTQGGIELLAQQGIYVLDELGQTKVDRNKFKGKTKGTSSDFNTYAIRSVLSAGKNVLLDTDSGDITIRAAQINSGLGTSVNARNGKVHLLITKEQSQHYLNLVRKGFWTIKTTTEQDVAETPVPNSIVGGFSVEALQGIDVEYAGKAGSTLADQIKEYEKMPDMKWMATLYNNGQVNGNVDWNQVELVYKHIHDSNTSLSPAAMAIIAICVAVAMGPMGAGFIGSGGGAIGATTVGGVTTISTTGAVLQAGALTLATSAAQNLAAGKSLEQTLKNMSSDDSLKSLAISMATAGAMQYTQLDMFTVAENSPVTAITLAKQAGQVMVDSVVKAGISVTIEGGNSKAYRDAFKQNLATNAVNQIGDAMVKKIGGLASGTSPQINEAMKYIALAGSGCIIGLATASVTNNTTSKNTVCYSAAGGAVVGEFVGELYSKAQQDTQQALLQTFLSEHGISSTSDISNLTQQQYAQLLVQQPKLTNLQISQLRDAGIDLAKLVAALTAFATGGDVNIASDSGDRTARNSSLLRFQAAMESVNSINQFLRLDEFITLSQKLQSAINNSATIDQIINEFVSTGKFSFLNGMSTVDALTAIINYLEVNGSSYDLIQKFEAVLSKAASVRGIVTVHATLEEERVALVTNTKFNLDNTILDHSVRVDAEALYNLILSTGGDPSKTPVAAFEQLITHLPPEEAKAARYSLGVSLGITQFLADSAQGTAQIMKIVATSSVGCLDYILYGISQNEAFRPGASDFLDKTQFLAATAANVDQLPAAVRDSFKAEMKRANDAIAAGDVIEGGKIYSAGALTLLTAVYGISKVANSTAQGLKDLGENLKSARSSFSDVVDNVDNEFGPANISLNAEIWTSRADLADFIKNNNLTLNPGWTIDRLYDEVLSKPKALRPLPSTYLPANYISAQLSKFDQGASRIMFKDRLDLSGPSQIDGTSFVAPTSDINQLLASANGDPVKLAKSLGLPDNYFFDKEGNIREIVKVDIPNPRAVNLRLPQGIEAGVNPQWLPFGKLLNGANEAIVDLKKSDLGITWISTSIKFN